MNSLLFIFIPLQLWQNNDSSSCFLCVSLNIHITLFFMISMFTATNFVNFLLSLRSYCLVCNIIILYPLFSCCIWLPSQWAVVVVSLPLSLFLYCHRLRCFINVLNIYLFTCSISVLKELCNWFWNKHTLAHSSTHTLPKRVAVLLPLSFSSAVRGPHTPTGSTVLCYCEMWML